MSDEIVGAAPRSRPPLNSSIDKNIENVKEMVPLLEK